MVYLFRGRSSHYRKSTIVKCVHNVYATISTRACTRVLKLILSYEVFLFMRYYFFTLFKEGIVRERNRNKQRYNTAAPRNFPMANSKSWRAWRANISRRYDSVNLIPYRAQREIRRFTTVRCSVWRKHSWMLYEYQRTICHGVLLFNTSNFAPWPRSFSLFLHTPVCDTDEVVGSCSIRARAIVRFSKPRIILAWAFGQLLEWISATRPGQIFWTGLVPARRTHLRPVLQKEKKFFPAS